MRDPSEPKASPENDEDDGEDGGGAATRGAVAKARYGTAGSSLWRQLEHVNERKVRGLAIIVQADVV